MAAPTKPLYANAATSQHVVHNSVKVVSFLSELEMFTNACCFVHSKDTNSSQGGN